MIYYENKLRVPIQDSEDVLTAYISFTIVNIKRI